MLVISVPKGYFFAPISDLLPSLIAVAEQNKRLCNLHKVQGSYKHFYIFLCCRNDRLMSGKGGMWAKKSGRVDLNHRPQRSEGFITASFNT